MTVIVSRANYTTDSNTFTLTNGSQTGRAVVVVASQFRNPPDMSTATFNSAAATSLVTGNHSVQSNVRTLVAYWDNAALPAAGGTFNVTCNSEIHTVFEISGWDEIAPEIVTDESLVGAPSPYSVAFVGSAASAGLFMATATASGTTITSSGGSVVEQQDTNHATLSKIDTAGDGSISFSAASSEHILTGIAFNPGPTTDYTQRKGSTFDVAHTLGTITTATLNAVNVFDHVSSQAAGTVSFTGAVTDEITTSGEYNLVLGDGTGTETYTVQVNVVGLASYNINKDGADQASLADVEFIVMTGAAGSRVIAEQITGVTTDVNGNTGAIEVPALSLNVGDPVFIMQRSATVDGGHPDDATLVAI